MLKLTYFAISFCVSFSAMLLQEPDVQYVASQNTDAYQFLSIIVSSVCGLLSIPLTLLVKDYIANKRYLRHKKVDKD